MTDELFESFKRAIQADNLQTALADFEALVEDYSDWRFYDPLTESVRVLYQFFDREIRSSNFLKRNAYTTALSKLCSNDTVTTLQNFDAIVQLRPKLIEEFEAKIKRARKPERKLELAQLLENEAELFRVLTTLVRSVTPAACLVDQHFRSVTHYKNKKNGRSLALGWELRPLARARNRVFLRPSLQSLEEYIATTGLVLNQNPKLRKFFLTQQADIDLEDWAIYLNLSQKHIDKLEVAVMVQSL